ncbi:MAG: NAD(P)-dependent oxidoreductase [Pseudomonadota bacterium]
MKVLVTGSSGWLGRHLFPILREAGHEPLGLDVVGSAWTDVIASVADRAAIDKLFTQHRFDGVIHAGALHKPDIARYPQQAFVDVNVTGTLNLLEAVCRHGVQRFIFTSTTSLMISQRIRTEQSDMAIWLDETSGPIEPRNIYGVTKLAAEALCRQHHIERGLAVVILRTARFFPEDDDTLADVSGPNLKANELLNRRATVRDMARAHLTALERVSERGFGLYIVSAPTPFARSDTQALKTDARAVTLDRFPEADALYAREGWSLPKSLGRVYDGTLIERDLGFRYETRFSDVLAALRDGRPSPVAHDPTYTSPIMHPG